MSVEEIRSLILPILKRHGASRAGLFGSVVRGEARGDSDVDVLVEINGDLTLLGFIGLKQELEDVLGRSVDLVEYDTLKPRIRGQVLKEQVAIL
jgi:predicted nucleotidyltransferase